MTALALYTTIYPGVEPYLADWYRSVRGQTDQDFELWIGLDAMDSRAAMDALGADPGGTWVLGEPGDTPALVRQRALAQIAERYEGVVLVDSDDVLHASRVATARSMLGANDLVGCALRLVDQSGLPVGVAFGLPQGAEPEDLFPQNNIFGLSNSAVRSDLLHRCLPIPASVVLVDWFLASRAWLLGARLAFDNAVGMDYRQHGKNMARVLPPFDADRIVRDTERVRDHFRILQASSPDGAIIHRVEAVAKVAVDIERFYERVVLRPFRLEQYLVALNALDIAPLWWSSVANPALRDMWAGEKEETT